MINSYIYGTDLMQRRNCLCVRVQKSANANAQDCECYYSRVQVKPLTSPVAHRNKFISSGIALVYSNSTLLTN